VKFKVFQQSCLLKEHILVKRPPLTTPVPLVVCLIPSPFRRQLLTVLSWKVHRSSAGSSENAIAMLERRVNEVADSLISPFGARRLLTLSVTRESTTLCDHNTVFILDWIRILWCKYMYRWSLVTFKVPLFCISNNFIVSQCDRRLALVCRRGNLVIQANQKWKATNLLSTI
jgi:hypothetical protein